MAGYSTEVLSESLQYTVQRYKNVSDYIHTHHSSLYILFYCVTAQLFVKLQNSTKIKGVIYWILSVTSSGNFDGNPSMAHILGTFMHPQRTSEMPVD